MWPLRWPWCSPRCIWCTCSEPGQGRHCSSLWGIARRSVLCWSIPGLANSHLPTGLYTSESILPSLAMLWKWSWKLAPRCWPDSSRLDERRTTYTYAHASNYKDPRRFLAFDNSMSTSFVCITMVFGQVNIIAISSKLCLALFCPTHHCVAKQSECEKTRWNPQSLHLIF